MKTNTQHTPGPWIRLHEDKEDKLPIQTKAIVTENASFGGVGEVIAWSNNYCARASEANANLIAAAPELLASETQFVQLCNNLAVALTEDQITEAIRELTSHCHAARAVISKATGGQL
jgi:hypothetical protein